MKIVQVLEEIELFREKILTLDKIHADFTAFANKLNENEMFEFLGNIEALSCSGAFNSELLLLIENLAKNEHIQKMVNFQRLDISDLSIDESHPDNGDLEDLIDRKSENAYEDLRGFGSPIIEELNSKLEQLLFIDERLLWK